MKLNRDHILRSLFLTGALAGAGMSAYHYLRKRHEVRLEEDEPLTTALLRQAELQPHRGQAPSSGGRFPRRFDRIFGPKYAKYDVSLMREVDVPKPGQSNPWLDSERRAADLFGASHLVYMPSGATFASRALAMMMYEMACLRKGPDAVVGVQWSVHISVLHMLRELGATVCIIPVETNALGFLTVMTEQALVNALDTVPNIGAIIASTPSYEGFIGNQAAWIKAAHDRGIAVGIDQAWCAEQKWLARFGGPQSALDLGADIVSLSLHKTVYAPGQSAGLARGTNSLVPLHIFEAYSLAMKSTSKSLPLLSGTEMALAELKRHGLRDIERCILTVEKEMKRFRHKGLGDLVLDVQDLMDRGLTQAVGFVPYRVTFVTHDLGVTGFFAGEYLRWNHGVQVAQPNICFFHSGVGINNASAITATFRGVEEMVRRVPRQPRIDPASIPQLEQEQEVIALRGVIGHHAVAMTYEKAIELLARAKYEIGGYPPGVCVIISGGKVTEKKGRYMSKLEDYPGARVYGHPASTPPKHIYVLVQ